MSTSQTAGQQVSYGASKAVKLVMLLVVAVTILLVCRIVLVFFEQLRQVPLYDLIRSTTDKIVLPFGGETLRIKTPYGTDPNYAFFDIAATAIVLVLLVFEYVLSALAGYFDRRGRVKPQYNTQVHINFNAPPPATPSTMVSDALTHGVQPERHEQHLGNGSQDASLDSESEAESAEPSVTPGK